VAFSSSVGAWSWGGLGVAVCTIYTVSAIPGYAGPGCMIPSQNAPYASTVGSFSWSGPTAAFCTGNSKSAIPSLAGPGCMIPSTLPYAGSTFGATVGTYSWNGATAYLLGPIPASVGGYSWGGVTAGVPIPVYAGVGNFSWQGTTALLAIPFIAGIGSYTWQGITAGVSSPPLNITVGAYAWYGIISILHPMSIRIPMARIITLPKPATDTIFYTFNFVSPLGPTETISTAVCTASVYTGVDASPSLVISGAAQIVGQNVNQLLTGGIPGVVYQILCTIVSNLGQTITLSTYLYVEGNLP
jgi:hypothetical protein